MAIPTSPPAPAALAAGALAGAALAAVLGAVEAPLELQAASANAAATARASSLFIDVHSSYHGPWRVSAPFRTGSTGGTMVLASAAAALLARSDIAWP